MTIAERRLCVLCAWKATCNKKFFMGEGKINCPDFSEDVSLKKKTKGQDENFNLQPDKNNSK